MKNSLKLGLTLSSLEKIKKQVVEEKENKQLKKKKTSIRRKKTSRGRQ